MSEQFVMERLADNLTRLRLGRTRDILPEMIKTAESEDWSYLTLLDRLTGEEVVGKEQKRISSALRGSGLPYVKTIDEFDFTFQPGIERRQVMNLFDCSFIERRENVIFLGPPGVGKTHLAAALGYEWVQRSYSVLFIPTFKLVGGLLRAKRDYELERELRRLDRFQVVILDDLGYVQQSREEMEVLFTFLAERYERRSVVITSNLVFSQWDQIFKDPLTTAAAIDRVVHHSRIIEFGADMSSVRAEEAARRQQLLAPQPATTGEG